jgi:hypothetical protein
MNGRVDMYRHCISYLMVSWSIKQLLRFRRDQDRVLYPVIGRSSILGIISCWIPTWQAFEAISRAFISGVVV